MIQNKNKGFTLIELLVVVAIIGILASIVLVSLSSARAKAKDAAVKSGIAQMVSQAEVDSNGGAYNTAPQTTNVCTTGGSVGTEATIKNMSDTITLSSFNNVAPKCSTNANGIAFYAPINAPAGGFFCSDNSGTSGIIVTGGTVGTNGVIATSVPGVSVGACK